MPATRTAALVSIAALATASLLTAGPASAETTAPGPTHQGALARAHRTTAATSVAAAAATGTIVYIHDHNVWLTRPDGSGQRAVTKDGTEASPYEHPTMSDAGIIAAMKGDTILRLDQAGKVLNTMVPEDLFVPDYGTVNISPVLDPEISPDGSKIAYSQLRLEHYGGGDYNYLKSEAETSYTDAAAWVGPDKYGIVLGFQPSWIGNSKVALDVDGDVQLANLGQDAQPWFWSKDVFTDFIELNEPEVSRDRQRVLLGTDGGFVVVKANGDPGGANPGKPHEFVCGLSSDGTTPVPVDPSSGPDSDSAAYSEGGDLWVALGLDACGEQTTLAKVATGGTEPDWSPAALAPPPVPGSDPGTGSGSTTQQFTLGAAPRLSGKARVGKRLRASAGTWTPAPGSVSYTWLRNGKVIAGQGGSSYKLGRKDRGRKVSVKVTVRRSGYATRSATSRALKVGR